MEFSKFILPIIISSIGIFSLQSHASTRVVSLVASHDGNRAYCNSENESKNEHGNKLMTMQLLSAIPEESSHKTKIKISSIRCENGQFIKDANPSHEHYLTIQGEQVLVKYSDYRLTVLDGDGHLLSMNELPLVATTGEAELESVVADDGSDPHITQFILTANKTVEYKGKTIVDEKIRFGTFHLVFKN